MRAKRWWPVLFMIAACGSRTGLGLLSEAEPVATVTPGPHLDASKDAPLDVFEASSLDRVPPIDANRRDVDRSDCPDADATLVYLVSSGNDLYSFYPPDLSFKRIGGLVCPGQAALGATPYSMAVDRHGVAYVVFTSGQLFRVSTATAACTPTSFRSGQLGFQTFGMGFATDTGGASETLYVSEAHVGTGQSVQSRGLGRIDVTSFALSLVAPYNPPVGRGELTGTADARLFIFWLDATSGSHLAEVDKVNANVIGADTLPIGTTNSAFAFAHWGGEFWIFTGEGGPSLVNRYRLTDRSTVQVTTAPSMIVGAGVSTCAPQ